MAYVEFYVSQRVFLRKLGRTARPVYGFKYRLCSPQEFGGLSGQIMKSYRTAKLSLTADEARYASEMQ